MKDPIVEAVCNDLRARSEIGILKYDITLDKAIDANSVLYWLQHTYEETLDTANYLKCVIESMRRGRPLTTPDTDYEKILNAELSIFANSDDTRTREEDGYMECLKILKARLHNTTPIETCIYPNCSCAVSFPAGYVPGLTSCPRSGTV